MSLLQSSGSVQRLANARVLAEKGLAVVFYPVKHLDTQPMLIHNSVIHIYTKEPCIENAVHIFEQ